MHAIYTNDDYPFIDLNDSMRRYIYVAMMMLCGIIMQMQAQGNGHQLVSRNLSAKDGLSSNQVYDILQDKHGYLWCATSNGLSRYDGYSFLNFNMLNTFLPRKLQASVGYIRYDAANDLLWATTSNFHTVCYSIEKNRFMDYTGKGDYLRQFEHSLFCDGTVWLYDGKKGIRCIKAVNGKFECKDYNGRNGHVFAEGVSCLYADAKSNAWVVSGSGLYYMNGGRSQLKVSGNVVSGQRMDDRMAFLTDRAVCYLFDSKGKLLRRKSMENMFSGGFPAGKNGIRTSVSWNHKWIVFTDKATFSLDMQTMKVEKPVELQMADAMLIEQSNGYSFVSSRSGDLIMFSPQGFYRRLNLLGNVRDSGNRNRKYSICAMGDTRFLIASYGNGAFIYDTDKGVIDHFKAGDGSHLLNVDFLTCASVDRDGNMWISQDKCGMMCLSKQSNTFMHYLYPSSRQHGGGSADAVMHIVRDANGTAGLICRNKQRFPFLASQSAIGSPSDIPYSIYASHEDSKGHFWEGTRGGGLYVDGKPCQGRHKGKDVTINDIYSIAEDGMGRIWLATIRATTDGGVIMARHDGDGHLEVRRFLFPDPCQNSVHYLSMDGKGLLWMTTSGGLCLVDTREKEISMKSFRLFDMANGKFPCNDLMTVRCTSRGEIWVGGIGAGLFRCRYDAGNDKLTFTQYTTDNGLGSDNVYSILEDASGNIWAGTENGLARLDIRTGRIDNNVLNETAVQSNSYQENSALRLSDGRLLFGTNDGLVVVNPDKASIVRTVSAVVPTITDVAIDGLSIYKKGGKEGAPSTWRCLNLENDQNSITFFFSNFDYAEAGASVYQYYLEGVDEGWSTVTNRNSASYNGLPPGDYVFHLRSMGRGDRWSDERLLNVHIAEPWYNTWFAWLAYFLVVGIVVCYVVRDRKEKFQLNQRMKMEKQVNDFRINFFTHVTHEFRTPLAIIQSAVNRIFDEKTGNVSRSSVRTAVRGTQRLSRLVTQLMEFRKINSDGLRLQVLSGMDIIGFVRSIYQDFWSVAKQKDITMNYQVFERKHEMTFDRHIVETVVYNLLSNAVKYTPEGGEVNVKVEADNSRNVIRIIVSDSGTGISDEQQKNLFRPFMHGYVSQGGMGIGLYVAKMMAEVHHGSLTYRKSGKLGGAEFAFSIPSDDGCYVPEDYLDTMALADNHACGQEMQLTERCRALLPEALNDVTVAVIEDDIDMQDLIRSELGVFFKVVTYSNGKQGLEGVRADKPALLVCDVMLPDMNGYDVVKELKDEPEGYAMPVIMLTALNDEKHQIKGYKAGADDYMVKPCNFNVLVARVIQLITWSRGLPKVSETALTASPSSQGGKSVKCKMPSAQGTDAAEGVEERKAKIVEGVVDRNLLNSFEAYVDQHLSDPSFTIDVLAEMMHMGRTKLYGKIRELTGETPNKYIMRQRMRKAADMLLSGEYNVSDVCYKVGMEDTSYFNKCFKNYYGVSPSKYGK